MAFDAAVGEEKERRRIAAGLHDNIGQKLALAQIRLNTARAAAGKSVRADLDESIRLIGQAIADTRSLTFELSPPVLDVVAARPQTRTWRRAPLLRCVSPSSLDDVELHRARACGAS
jgi:signal transduction histidine kinase